MPRVGRVFNLPCLLIKFKLTYVLARSLQFKPTNTRSAKHSDGFRLFSTVIWKWNRSIVSIIVATITISIFSQLNSYPTATAANDYFTSIFAAGSISISLSIFKPISLSTSISICVPNPSITVIAEQSTASCS